MQIANYSYSYTQFFYTLQRNIKSVAKYSYNCVHVHVHACMHIHCNYFASYIAIATDIASYSYN